MSKGTEAHAREGKGVVLDVAELITHINRNVEIATYRAGLLI